MSESRVCLNACLTADRLSDNHYLPNFVLNKTGTNNNDDVGGNVIVVVLVNIVTPLFAW